jgi:hypothetical protein
LSVGSTDGSQVCALCGLRREQCFEGKMRLNGSSSVSACFRGKGMGGSNQWGMSLIVPLPQTDPFNKFNLPKIPSGFHDLNKVENFRGQNTGLRVVQGPRAFNRQDKESRHLLGVNACVRCRVYLGAAERGRC